MESHLSDLLSELEQLGLENDARAGARMDKFLNITRDTGAFLNLLARAVRATRILEIGTSNGYSTLWLADAARATGGRVTTVERRTARAEMARANFERADFSSFIDQHVGEAGPFLASLPASSVDFLFLDAARDEYPNYWPDLQRILVPNALVVADNATSHPAEMAPFLALVESAPGYRTSLVPVGKGELLILKLPAPSASVRGK